ncbi:MAG TPA: symmetrical bis(5'-nucleosyl)-tetraphosphatase [Gammaproteobacteria bacterium]|nr:symmetrical bis(5'-nucleosyl)-tetraphosphatase [Gammaproteobacteria bacterium]
MAVYAVGDIQGCFDELRALLDKLHFDPVVDRLWLVGDLVNRGPKSLETLRFVRKLGPAAVTVLGNHDLHLIAAVHGRSLGRGGHTLDAVLAAHDRDELIDWLRWRPLLHHDDNTGFTMVHAGLPPQWDLARAQQSAHEVETVLRGPQLDTFIEHMYGNKPNCWSDELSGWERLRFCVNCFTRMRYCDADGRLDFASKGPPGSQSKGLFPWFELPRASGDLKLVFGHWSTLGPRDDPGIYPLDTGCLWGGAMTALRLDGEPQWFSLKCAEQRTPG